ncbi:hypothetical protein N403_07745 [Helicobacter pylori FD430]|nr:hypothetical protein N403_07745 [Helicobacter pylori FD430]
MHLLFFCAFRAVWLASFSLFLFAKRLFLAVVFSAQTALKTPKI